VNTYYRDIAGKEALTYQDVLLMPQYSDIESRAEVDIGNNLDTNIHLEFPIIASPMDTISESSMAWSMNANGGMAIVHRYNSIDEQCGHVDCLPAEAVVGGAIGVTGDFVERAQELVRAGVSVLCVDVAHGHHSLTRNALKILRQKFPDFHIMAGNIATLEGFDALAQWGASSVRCNIGGGSICTTRIQTGHGVPGLHTIFDCARSEWAGDVKIVADGGIRNAGDVVKALAAGADFVMVGSLLSGTDQAPGKLVKTTDGNFKQYRGMASRDAQVNWRGSSSSPEGISSMVPWKGDVNKILEEMKGSLKSGFSYSGARTLRELQTKAVFIRQTDAGQAESSAHILKRYR
jgi:IMP dehydrogenase